MANDQKSEKKYYKKKTKKTTFNQYDLTFCDSTTGEILKQTDEKLKVAIGLVKPEGTGGVRLLTVLPNSTIVAMNSSIKIAIQYISESIKAHKGGSSESSSDSNTDNNNKEGDK